MPPANTAKLPPWVTGIPLGTIRTSSRLSKLLQSADAEVRYDAWACKILGEPMVLAALAKTKVPELKSLTVPEIASRIVGLIRPRTALGTLGNLQDAFLASSTMVDKRPGAAVLFDVSVVILLPEDTAPKWERRKYDYVVFDVEPQTSDSPWDRIFSRAEYSVATLLTGQHERGFSAPNYEQLAPVYSVWVFPRPPASGKNRVMEYDFSQNLSEVRERVLSAVDTAVSKVTADTRATVAQAAAEIRSAADAAFDASTDPTSKPAVRRFFRDRRVRPRQNIITLWLGDPDETNDRALRLLDTIFSPDMSARKKAAILEKEYGIPMDTTRHIIREVGQMGTFSAALVERGRELARTEVKQARTEVKQARTEVKQAKTEARKAKIRADAAIAKKEQEHRRELQGTYEQIATVLLGRGLTSEEANAEILAWFPKVDHEVLYKAVAAAVARSKEPDAAVDPTSES